jgi:hypothetical protein
MALLNLTAFTPQMAFSVCSTLRALGGAAEIETLQVWMSPATVYEEGGAPRTAGLGLRESIALCETIDLVRRDDTALVLQQPFESLDGFRRELRDRVLMPERNVDLFNESPEGGVQAHELTRALAWFMHLRSSLGPYSTANYERYQSVGPRVIENDNRWAVFDRWVVFLGFGWRTGEGLIPDPARVLADRLDEVIAPGDELPLPRFLDDLATRIPVLDGGSYHEAFRSATGDSGRDNRRVSEPLSLALMRLQRRGTLEFYGGGDAEARVFRVGTDIDSSNQFVKRTAVGTSAGSVR